MSADFLKRWEMLPFKRAKAGAPADDFYHGKISLDKLESPHLNYPRYPILARVVYFLHSLFFFGWAN
jgi:hypothetical protein